MAQLTAAQVAILQRAGIAPVAINAYQAGRAAPGIIKQIDGTLQNDARSNVSWATRNNPILPSTPVANGGIGAGGVFAPPSSAPATSGGSPWGRDNPWAGSGAATVPNRRGTPTPSKPSSSSSSGRSTGKQGPAAGNYGDVFNGLEFPEYTYQPPTLQINDFTEQANSQVDAAFAPLFAAYAKQKQDINTKAGQDRQVVGGLYDQYVKSIAEGAAQTDQRYDTAGSERAQQGQALAGNVGNYYQSANASTADLLKSIGAQQAAPELLQQGANEQAVQQSQIGQGTQAMQDYYSQQNQGAQDQAVGYQDAARNESVRGQANVLADAAAQIGGVDRQEAGSRTQQATTALDIANQLTNRDFQMQQANVGNAMNNAQFGYQSSLGGYNAARQNLMDQFDLNFKKTQLDQGQQQIDIEKTKAQGGTGSGVTPSGLNATALQLGDQIGQQAVGDIQEAIVKTTAGSGVRPGDPDKMGNAFMAALSQAPQIAAANGLSTTQVQTAMIQMWKDSFGAADTIPVPKQPGQM